jgi:hypothetical protein
VKVPPLTTGSSRDLYGPRRAQQLYEVGLEAPAVRIEGSAPGRFRAADGTQGPLEPGTYCTTSQACNCPRIGKGKAVFAISGPSGEARIRVTGLSGCAKPVSQLTVSGPLEHTFTEDAVCGDYFGGYQVNLSEFAQGRIWLVRMIIPSDDFHGAGEYTFLGKNNLSGPFVELTSSTGRWGTDQAGKDAVAGRTVLEPGLAAGNLSAQMPASFGGTGSASANGAFRCG